ncbi:MAG: hypothetical protein H7A25_20105 [Leptospiraceae bacterium]|nr:hypothetical protein [Leptospiraceae bacterium]MCP5502213.1 hypothetical protein [Leptospiraceae bacterium]
MAVPSYKPITVVSDDLVNRLVDATSKNHTSNNDRFMPSQLRESKGHIKILLNACKAHGVTDPGQIAYVLGTVRRESNMGNLMLEKVSDERANAAYANIIGNGDEASGDGARFKGRGYVQITGRANYAEWSQKLGVDLVENPDKAMEPSIAAKICVIGMRDGSYTKRAKLADFINASKRDFLNARKIVNPRELERYPAKAKLIVQYSESYFEVLSS